MVIESVLTISNLLITEDGILGWGFVMYGKLGKDSVMEEVSTITNLWLQGMEDWTGNLYIWGIGKGFSDGSSLNNQKFCDHRGWDFVIYGILGNSDSNGQNCGWKIGRCVISASDVST